MNSNLISLFGSQLSSIIKKSPLACRGLIRFSITKYTKENNLKREIRFEDFKEIINGNIRNLLSEVNFPQIDEIIEELERLLIEQQSIFTMDK